jgi:hypothetical protein
MLEVLRSNCSPRTFAASTSALDELRTSTLPIMPTAQLTYGFNQTPIAEHRGFIGSSVNPIATPRSVDTTMAEATEVRDDEVDKDDSELEAAISADTAYVFVTRKVVSHTFRDGEVFYWFEGREAAKESRKKSNILYEGKIMPCRVYTSSKGSKY